MSQRNDVVKFHHTKRNCPACRGKGEFKSLRKDPRCDACMGRGKLPGVIIGNHVVLAGDDGSIFVHHRRKRNFKATLSQGRKYWGTITCRQVRLTGG